LFGGFGPTFYTRLGETRLPYLIHGAAATLWMVMLVAQSWLITHGQSRWHRRIGWSSVVVVPVLLASGFYMVRLMLSVRLEEYGPLAYSLTLIDILSWLLLRPALGRFLAFWVPGVESLPQALDPMMILTELVAVGRVVDDWRGVNLQAMPAVQVHMHALRVDTSSTSLQHMHSEGALMRTAHSYT